MPIGGPEFSRVLQTARLDYLPDVQSFKQWGQGAALDRAITEEWRARTAASFIAGAQITLASNVQSVGIPLTELRKIGGEVVGVYDMVAKAMGEGSLSETVVDAVSEASVALGITDTAVGLATDVASVVPIIGAVVGLVFSFVDMVKQVRQEEREERERPRGSFSAFVPELDELAFRSIIQAPLQKSSWEQIWSPVSWDRPKFRHVKLQNGLRIAAEETAEVAGAIPGVASLARSWELSDRGGRAPRVREVGDTLPTATQQATWLWGRVAATGPTLFTINVPTLSSRWSDYLTSLRASVDTLKPRWRDAFVREGDRQFGWSNPANTTPIKSLRVFERRQWSALNTIAVAYLSSDMPALTGTMRTRWEQRRRELLSHPARMLVDTRNVPDREYLAALHASGLPRFQGPQSITSASDGERREIQQAFASVKSDPPPMPPIVTTSPRGNMALAALAIGATALAFIRR